jgi:transcriptional regulator with XRE-family HTH domain
MGSLQERRIVMTPAQHLKGARERLGQTPEQVARAVGLTVATYYDLENCNDLYNAVSLGELALMHKKAPIQLRVLRDLVRQYLSDHTISLSTFEAKVGWNLGSFLEDPDVAYREWNVDCLRAICRELGLDWLDAIPGGRPA